MICKGMVRRIMFTWWAFQSLITFRHIHEAFFWMGVYLEGWLRNPWLGSFFSFEVEFYSTRKVWLAAMADLRLGLGLSGCRIRFKHESGGRNYFAQPLKKAATAQFRPHHWFGWCGLVDGASLVWFGWCGWETEITGKVKTDLSYRSFWDDD